MHLLSADIASASAATSTTTGTIASAGWRRTAAATLLVSVRYGWLSAASSSSSTTTPATIARVPNHEISAKPVRKTPRMLPAVAAAWMRPTTRPVESSELSESFTIIGVGVPSITEGRKNISVVTHSTWRIADQELGAANASTSRAKNRISAVAAARPEVQHRQRRAARARVGDPAAEPVAERESGEHDADHRRPRVERHADVGRDDPARRRARSPAASRCRGRRRPRETAGAAGLRRWRWVPSAWFRCSVGQAPRGP